MTYTWTFPRPVGAAVDDPARYLAIGIISQAVEDARRGYQRVTVDPDWADLAGVSYELLAQAGVGVEVLE